MFCVIEIGLTILGISILITTLAQGRFPVGTDRELRGAPAYLVGGLLTAVLPVALIIACGVVGNKFAQGKEKELENDDDASYLWIDIVAIAACGIPAGIIAAVGNKSRRRKKKKKRRLDDDYDDYDRPVRRKRRDEEEDEEELRSSRRSEPEPDPDDDAPPRRRRSLDADDEDAPPRRRRLEEDDDDDFRPRRRRRDDDD